jgi:FtsP/CotA-like multicopper oxidase with cupredoxin domain
MSNRRSFLQSTLGLGAGLLTTRRAVAAPRPSEGHVDQQVAARGGYMGVSSGSLSKVETNAGPVNTTPVITTDVGDLPHELDGDTKVFRLTAHVLKRQIARDKTIDLWGYNGSSPGPTIQVTQGDRVRIIFRNELPEPTSIHWHGFEDRIGYDGMPGISQEPVLPGNTFVYEFNIHQEGTYFYHSHMAMQELAGMLGAFIMHPRVPYRPHCEKDFVIHLQEYAVLANQSTPDTMMMEFNWLLLNGRAGPMSTPLIVRLGERVRIRFINLGMDHHPMHVHGHTFYVTGTEGGRIPETAWWPGNTVLVGVAQSRTVEFVADNAGDWMLHCHLPHHMMNQMASQVGPMTRKTGAMRGMEGMSIPHAGPVGPLDGTGLDPGMMGMMAEQMGGAVHLSAEQKCNLDSFDMSQSSMTLQAKETTPDAEKVPNFPQDAYMEGPMMTMDALVAKPENLGLRPDWSRFMQGMMTFVRVLPPAEYDKVMDAMRAANRPGDPYSSAWNTASDAFPG